MPCPANFQGMECLGIPDPVPIDFALSGEPGVKLPGDPATGNDPDAGRQIGIQSDPPGRGRESFGGNVYVRGLGKGMHACIRSAGAVHSGRSTEDLCQRRLEMILTPFRLGWLCQPANGVPS